MKEVILAFTIFNVSTSVFAQTGAVNYDGLTNREAISFENIKADISKYIVEYTSWNLTSENVCDWNDVFDFNQISLSKVEDKNLLNEDRKKKSKTGEILCPRNISRYAAHAKTI